jgi:hypothetical protein
MGGLNFNPTVLLSGPWTSMSAERKIKLKALDYFIVKTNFEARIEAWNFLAFKNSYAD